MSRIAITINSSWNIYNFRIGLVKALQKQGFEVVAVAPKDDFSSLLEQEGCTFVEAPMESKGSNPIKDLFLIFRLFRIYKKIKPDIVLHYTIKPNIYGSIAAHLAGIPSINNVSGLGTVFLHNNLVSSIAHSLYKIAFRFPRKVFFQNEDDLKLFLEKKLVRKEIAGLVPGSGVNIQKFTPAEFRRGNPFTFLVVSRLLHDKGIKEYAEAAKILKARLPEVHFQVVGSIDPGPLGIPQQWIIDWQKSGLIEYIPFQKDIRSFVQKADCIVLPSYREGTPRTLLEAAAMAKPIIATNVPGCREVVADGENGFLCSVKNSADLAAKMEKMATLPEENLKSLGENSRERVILMFDERIVIRRYYEAIQEVFPDKINLSLI